MDNFGIKRNPDKHKSKLRSILRKTHTPHEPQRTPTKFSLSKTTQYIELKGKRNSFSLPRKSLKLKLVTPGTSNKIVSVRAVTDRGRLEKFPLIKRKKGERSKVIEELRRWEMEYLVKIKNTPSFDNHDISDVDTIMSILRRKEQAKLLEDIGVVEDEDAVKEKRIGIMEAGKNPSQKK